MKFKQKPTPTYSIDFSCILENTFIITGWYLFKSDSYCIEITDENGSKIEKSTLFKGDRNDVINHLKLTNLDSKIGFVLIFEKNNSSNNFILNINDDGKEIALPISINEHSNVNNLLNNIVNFSDSQSDIVISFLKSKVSKDYFLSTKPVFHSIDGAGLFEESIMIIGWCIFEDTLNKTIQLFDENNNEIVEYDILFGNRNDVISHLGIDKSNLECGFIILIKKELDNIPSKYNLKFSEKGASSSSEISFDKQIDTSILNNTLNEFSSKQKTMLLSLYHKYGNILPLFNLINKEITEKEKNLNFGIDKCLRLNSGIFICGWLNENNSTLNSIHIQMDNYLSENILPILYRTSRPDVNKLFNSINNSFKAGFYFYLPIQNEYINSDIHLIFQLENNKIFKTNLFEKTAQLNEINNIKAIFSGVDIFSSSLDIIFNNHISKALKDVWSNKLTINTKNALIKEYGLIPSKPKCSIIVPIYGRADFIMYQLCQFVNDNDFKEFELIYVLDDPNLESIIFDYCAEQYALFQLPFKLIYNYENNGFGGANNLGAYFSKSDYMLLLNSDVLPSESGWVKKLISTYDSLKKPGLLGCKLVYENEAIQHLGMNFKKHEKYDIYINMHPGKGLHENLLDKFETKPITAVTAACVMIKKELFESINGFDLEYIIGDFEDSDMNLKLTDLGFTNYITTLVKMYHLERQSQNLVDQGDWKHKLTLYNGWQQTKKWGHLIKKIIN